MKEIKNDIIKKYQYKEYVVYVKETKSCYEYYLQNEQYGVLTLMFGLPKSRNINNDIENNIIIVYHNIENYIKTYKEEYED